MRSKERKWWIAGLFSLLEPGLGQIYNGQIRKGLLFLIWPYVLYFLGLYLIINSFSPMKTYLLFAFIPLFYVAAIADAVIHARKCGKNYELKRYNRVYAYVAVMLLIVGIDFFYSDYLRSTVAQSYKLSSVSMEPTLMRGDHILVDRRASARNPVHGELIVFQFPKDEKKDYIKRVVAIGGDSVQVMDKTLLVNGVVSSTEKYSIHADDFIEKECCKDNFGPVTIPQGSFFVLGDNRDRSYDSRFWGFVDGAKIKGKVVAIYWSWDRLEKVVRWDRIGLSP